VSRPSVRMPLHVNRIHREGQLVLVCLHVSRLLLPRCCPKIQTVQPRASECWEGAACSPLRLSTAQAKHSLHQRLFAPFFFTSRQGMLIEFFLEHVMTVEGMTTFVQL
jgi:hypothetical protein